MIPVYSALNLADAQFVVDRLSSANIRTYVRNEALQGALGELPLSARPEVCIFDERELKEALAIVQEHEAATHSSLLLADQVCAVCGEQSPGNFELCWKCQSPFAEH